MTILHLRKSINRSPLRRDFVLTLLLSACFGLSPTPNAFGVTPAPDGGYPGNNTAEGTQALFSLTTGVNNTAIGKQALFSNTTGRFNTATGSLALLFNDSGTYNTATGYQALVINTTGSNNTATGYQALGINTTGGSNTANGVRALHLNTTGDFNTANGVEALHNNTTGSFNTANGAEALLSNATGGQNTAIGFGALDHNTTGSNNIALGFAAGSNLTTGDHNIDIGNKGVAAEANTIRIGTKEPQTATFIAGISGKTAAGGIPVIVNANGKLGTTASSARFKDEIKPMDKVSEAILALKPVTFRYKQELDPEGIPQFGLIAEEVEKVDPDLVARDDQGKIYTVRYDAVNAMLLNEFLKEHRTVQELRSTAVKQEATITQLKSTVAQQEATAARQDKEIKALTASLKEQASQIQKVSDQLEVTKFATGRIRGGGPAPQIALTNQ